MAGSKYVDILNDGLLIQLSIKVPKHVTPSNLSYYLGFNAEEGDHAQILGLVQLDPKSAYESLVHKFVNRHGTDGKSALKLRLIFLENDMVACALIIEKELDKYRITYPSRADTVISEPLDLPSTSNVKPELEKAGIANPSRADTLTGQDFNPPSPPHDNPELKKAVIVIPSPADTLTGQDVNPPSSPHDKPGSETPVAPTPRGLKPLGRTEELQQQPPSISRGMIADTVNSQALDLPSSSHVKPGSGTPVLPTASGLQPQPRDPPVAPHQQQPYFGSGWIFAVVFAMIAVIIYFVKS